MLLCTHCCIASGYFNPSAVRHGLPCIYDDIVNNLPYLVSIETTRAEVIGNNETARHRRAAEHEIRGIPYKGEKKIRFHYRGAAFCKRQQLLGETARPFNRRHCSSEIAGDFFIL